MLISNDASTWARSFCEAAYLVGSQQLRPQNHIIGVVWLRIGEGSESDGGNIRGTVFLVSSMEGGKVQPQKRADPT
jgi:hypothetical protein